MTDKQIIIDGCDVSGCSLYEDNPKYRMWGTCDCMRSMVDQSGYDELAGAECKGYNCYYKQLKRKEQECERLDNENKRLVGEIANNFFDELEQLDQLKAENDELKKLLKDGGLHNLSLMAEKRVLLQTLAEIKELIQSDYCTEIGSCEFCAEIGDCLNRKILQKISEVEND